MAYDTSAALAADATFLSRLRVALLKKAAAQMSSANDRSVRWAKRTALAQRIIADPDIVLIGGSQTAPTVRSPLVVQQFAWAVVTANPTWTVAAPPTDAQLDTGITAAVVDAVAAVADTD